MILTGWPRLLLYVLCFTLGWGFGMSQDLWHRWIVGAAAAYMAGAAIRMLWA